MAVQIVSEQPQEVYRGRECNELKNDLNQLEKFNQKLLFDLNNVNLTIEDHCQTQNSRIRSVADKILEDINKQKEILIKQVDDYQQICKQNMKKQAQEKVNSVNIFLDQQRNMLNQTNIGD